MSLVLIEAAKANHWLKDALVGDRFFEFKTGDVWVLRLNESEFFLVFQEMSFVLKNAIRKAIEGVDEALLDCVDPDYISCATVLAAMTRRTIISAAVNSDAALSITFDGGGVEPSCGNVSPVGISTYLDRVTTSNDRPIPKLALIIPSPSP